MRLLSSPDRRQRNDGARAGRERRRRRPAPRHHGRGSRAAVRPARRRQDRQPPELEGPLQGQLGQDAQRLDLRSRRRSEEPDVPREIQEPVVPREAHARPGEVPHHLGSLRGDARNGSRDRGACRRRARALLHRESAHRGPVQGCGQGCPARSGRVASHGQGVISNSEFGIRNSEFEQARGRESDRGLFRL